MMYELVQTEYNKGGRRYTYLAPSTWGAKPGDRVKSGHGVNWSTVVRLGAGEWRGPYRVLTEFKPATVKVSVELPRDLAEQFADHYCGYDTAGEAVEALRKAVRETIGERACGGSW